MDLPPNTAFHLMPFFQRAPPALRAIALVAACIAVLDKQNSGQFQRLHQGMPKAGFAQLVQQFLIEFAYKAALSDEPLAPFAGQITKAFSEHFQHVGEPDQAKIAQQLSELIVNLFSDGQMLDGHLRELPS